MAKFVQCLFCRKLFRFLEVPLLLDELSLPYVLYEVLKLYLYRISMHDRDRFHENILNSGEMSGLCVYYTLLLLLSLNFLRVGPHKVHFKTIAKAYKTLFESAQKG